ncbi:MAG TPA: hypothetical protein VG326_02835 [Tepidisphaeraceae bacterium]|jgi:hypothetical protein|nr:hypothetical protein [Tepidisphaeraceae bacterium]
MGTSNVFVVDWPRKLAVWLGLATLIPLVAYFGAAALFSPPDEEAYNNARNSLSEQMKSPLPAERDAAREKLERLDKDHQNADLGFARRLFWTCYVVGLVAVTVGLFIPINPVGAGLMFGGIIAIANGCYNAWDKLGRWLRFDSLLLLLVVLFALSLFRFSSRFESRSEK